MSTASPSRTTFSPTVQAQVKIALFRCSIKSEIRTVAVTRSPMWTGALKLSVCEM